MYNNNFSGTVPTQLTELIKLKYMYINGNKFSGSVPALENFTNLSKSRLFCPSWFYALFSETACHFILLFCCARPPFNSCLPFNPLSLIRLDCISIITTKKFSICTTMTYKGICPFLCASLLKSPLMTFGLIVAAADAQCQRSAVLVALSALGHQRNSS